MNVTFHGRNEECAGRCADTQLKLQGYLSADVIDALIEDSLDLEHINGAMESCLNDDEMTISDFGHELRRIFNKEGEPCAVLYSMTKHDFESIRNYIWDFCNSPREVIEYLNDKDIIGDEILSLAYKHEESEKKFKKLKKDIKALIGKYDNLDVLENSLLNLLDRK